MDHSAGLRTAAQEYPSAVSCGALARLSWGLSDPIHHSIEPIGTRAFVLVKSLMVEDVSLAEDSVDVPFCPGCVGARLGEQLCIVDG